VSQQPENGGRAKKGSTISVTAVGTQVADVPTVVGQGGDTAQQFLEAQGFEVAVEESESSFAEEGKVTGQNPRGGAMVEVGSEVTISVGTGPSTVEVPSVYGNTADQAAGVLEQAGLQLGKVSEDYSSEVAAGQIFFQDPAEGESIEPGSAVAVTVSLGPEKVQVPDVYGLTLAAAQQTVADAGFYYNVVEVTNDEPAGTALSTEPGAGTLLEPEATVTIYYSGGPPEPTAASPAEEVGNGAPNAALNAGEQAREQAGQAVRDAVQGTRVGDGGNRGRAGRGDGGGNGGDGND
jgi:serine/threonine-protein kinase